MIVSTSRPSVPGADSGARFPMTSRTPHWGEREFHTVRRLLSQICVHVKVSCHFAGVEKSTQRTKRRTRKTSRGPPTWIDPLNLTTTHISWPTRLHLRLRDLRPHLHEHLIPVTLRSHTFTLKVIDIASSAGGKDNSPVTEHRNYSDNLSKSSSFDCKSRTGSFFIYSVELIFCIAVTHKPQ